MATTRKKTHLDDSQIEDYCLGKIPEPELEEVEEHLTDLWALNLASMQWTAVKKRGCFPNPRTGIACAYVTVLRGPSTSMSVGIAAMIS